VKASKGLRFVDTFLVGHAVTTSTAYRYNIKFAMEMEVHNAIPFSDTFVKKRGPKLST
jgi:hypothetical protein